ncbi:CBS domain-containing protein [Actinophytocola sp.]|uniref:CBS domain-containing protein n=1 Tax=Actinophytocola sp. TaxID=1872138 RepID=UPI0025B7FB4B|nr:CBS domain-containing protein [Actinophytocola sp.]
MGSGTDVAELATALLDARQRSMPIVDGSRVVGIVTRRDIVATVARDDATVADDVRHRLEVYGGKGRWRVACRDGVVTIGDQFDDEADRHVATVIAESVPGVVRAQAIAVHEEDDR